MVRFVSTRDKNGPSCSVSEALLKGLAPDGGLYVPSTMPQRPSDFTLKEGVSYAIIISNLLVPLIEKATLPKAFGKGGKK